jgi:type I restriction enzyme, S subunit
MERRLPEGWTRIRLIDVLQALESGARPKGGLKEVEDGVPSIGGEHLDKNGYIIFDKMGFVPRDFYNNLRRGRIQESDVLVVKDGATTGKVALIRKDFPYSEASVNEHVFICRPNKNYLLPEYLFYNLFSFDGQNQIKKSIHGSAQGGIITDFASDYKITIPHLEIQRQIVAILDKAEETKRLRAQADELAGRLLQSMFLVMFGDPMKNPKGWKKARLGEILSESPQNGLYKPETAYGNGTPILRIDSFYDGEVISLDKLKRLKCSENEIDKFKLEIGDILINRVNSLEYLGKCGLIEALNEDTVYESNMMRIRLKTEIINPVFFS